MRWLACFLFLITNTCFSQEAITVKSTNGEKLADVSIFQLSESNILLGITDSTGTLKLTLNENQKYLFHLLGYIDKTFTAKELKNLSSVNLEPLVYQLNEVIIGKQKTKLIKIVNKPSNWSLGEANTIKTTFERVVPIKIEKSGFLYKFSLYVHQNFPGEVRTFRFILLNDKKGMPGSSLLNASIVGSLKKRKMVFSLDSLGVFIEKGNYYIGYETQNSGKPNNHFKNIKTKNGLWASYPVLFVEGKNMNSPRAFMRSNFKRWYLGEFSNESIKEQSGKKYIDIGYELEMLIPVAN